MKDPELVCPNPYYMLADVCQVKKDKEEDI